MEGGGGGGLQYLFLADNDQGQRPTAYDSTFPLARPTALIRLWPLLCSGMIHTLVI